MGCLKAKIVSLLTPVIWYRGKEEKLGRKQDLVGLAEPRPAETDLWNGRGSFFTQAKRRGRRQNAERKLGPVLN